MKVTILIKAINRNEPFYLACGSPLILYVQNMMHHIAHCCLEGSTMSNLVHRRRRCARIIVSRKLLPGGQYARGWEGLSLFIALDRMVTFCKEGGGMLLVWVLRARSNKTKAEA